MYFEETMKEMLDEIIELNEKIVSFTEERDKLREDLAYAMDVYARTIWEEE